MKEYLSYFSAATHWNIPYWDTFIALGNAGGVGNAGKVGLPEEQACVELTVPICSSRVRRKGFHLRGCDLPLPAGAVVHRNEQMVASPELLFLQLAERLSIHRLILLGLLLCSHSPGTVFRGDYLQKED